MVSKRQNIYPRNLENIKAVLLYYFPKEKHSDIDSFALKLYDDRVFELNDIEYVSEVIATHYQTIAQHFKLNAITSPMQVLFNAVGQVLLLPEHNWHVSKSGKESFKGLKLDLEELL